MRQEWDERGEERRRTGIALLYHDWVFLSWLHHGGGIPCMGSSTWRAEGLERPLSGPDLRSRKARSEGLR
jgi:hypothetical protein